MLSHAIEVASREGLEGSVDPLPQRQPVLVQRLPRHSTRGEFVVPHTSDRTFAENAEDVLFGVGEDVCRDHVQAIRLGSIGSPIQVLFTQARELFDELFDRAEDESPKRLDLVVH
jgi:hypothetical protein